jgi:HAE1 family hydrophobic/amphiphilic exporter-1
MKFIPEFSVKNPVAVNIAMATLILGGLYYANTIVREFFPRTDPETIIITVAWPGSTPEEVEDGVTRKVEDAIQDIPGIDKFFSYALEGFSGTVIRLERGANKRKILDDAKQGIDSIDDFPDEAEEPTVVDVEFNTPTISVVVYGDASDRRLKEVAEEVEDHMRRSIGVSDVRSVGERLSEVLVEVDPVRLEQYNLTYAEVAQAIRRDNVDVPGGEIKEPAGSILVRALGEQDDVERIEGIVVRAGAGGSKILVRDVAEVVDGFRDVETLGLYKGKRAISLTALKNQEQDAIQVAAQVKKYVEERNAEFAGEAIKLETRADQSRFIRQRQEMLARNGVQGFILVFICLLLFLERRVAFWAAAGLPVSFLGTFILMHLFGATVNMISLFGLIIVVGMIVDDAIVIGENVFRYYEMGVPAHKAAIEGAKEVTYPVIAAILTTIAAFIPLLFLDGVLGDFLGVIPIVVISSLAVSLLEALMILPSHLAESLEKKRVVDEKRRAALVAAGHDPGAHLPAGATERLLGSLAIGGLVAVFLDIMLGGVGPRAVSIAGSAAAGAVVAFFTWRHYDGFGSFKEKILGDALANKYEIFLKWIVRWRYVFIASMVCAVMLSVGLVAAGIVKFVFIQSTDSETVIVDVEMAAGTSAEDTMETLRRVERQARAMPEVEGAFSIVGKRFDNNGFSNFGNDSTIGQIIIDLFPAEIREDRKLRSSEAFLAAMRVETPPLPGVNQIKFEARQGGPGGKPIELEIRGRDEAQLDKVAEEVLHELNSYAGVVDLEDDRKPGKPEARVALLPGAESLGLSTTSIATQVRGAFFGEEAQSFQRAHDETKVRVRLNKAARASVDSLENFRVKLPDGQRVPLGEVASVRFARGYGALNRIDGFRAVKVTSDVDQALANAAEVRRSLDGKIAALAAANPGVTFEYGGEQLEVAKSMGSLKIGFPAALVGIFILLAVQFGSYLQPIIIMTAIPFGIVGAILGHIVMGYPVTILSMIGIVALSGIVVNDSIVLVDFVNNFVRAGHSLHEAIVQAGKTRLRPILLTSATTIFGLAPLVFFERSFQAQFLIPMAVSICFGLAFATIIVLMLVPCLYLVLEDARHVWSWLLTGDYDRPRALAQDRVHLEEKIAGSYAGGAALPGMEQAADPNIDPFADPLAEPREGNGNGHGAFDASDSKPGSGLAGSKK